MRGIIRSPEQASQGARLGFQCLSVSSPPSLTYLDSSTLQVKKSTTTAGDYVTSQKINDREIENATASPSES
jgi:hypothetical protein